MKDLVPLLDKLGLTGMKMHLSEILNTTGSQGSDKTYMILKKLLEIECEYKKSRSLNYRLRLAKLPTIKLLSETVQAKLVEHIEINEVIDNNNNIMLIGGAGSAKTHLAIGLAFVALEKNYRVRFYTLNELASQLLSVRAHNHEVRFMESIKKRLL